MSTGWYTGDTVITVGGGGNKCTVDIGVKNSSPEKIFAAANSIHDWLLMSNSYMSSGM
jgi:hypothetical protein